MKEEEEEEEEEEELGGGEREEEVGEGEGDESSSASCSACSTKSGCRYLELVLSREKARDTAAATAGWEWPTAGTLFWASR